MDIETAQRHLVDLRARPMYVGAPEFGYFRYDEMLGEEAGLIVHIESFQRPELRLDQTLYYSRKHEVIEQIKDAIKCRFAEQRQATQRPT